MSDLPPRRLGNSGLAVSPIGLGCNNLGHPGTVTNEPEAATDLVRSALDAGITLFDTADNYGSPAGRSEELLGAALGSRRSEAVVATKFGTDLKGVNGPDGGARGSRRYVRVAVEASLRRLNTDWIDLYQLHRPDPLTPMEETLAALDDLITAGKVRYIGHSNLKAWQLADAAWIAREHRCTPFISAQNEYSLLSRGVETDLIPAAERFGVGVLPYYPLANGLLTDKYRRDTAPEGSRLRELKPELLESAPWERLDLLRSFAQQRGLKVLEIAFGWLLAQPLVGSVIAGATRGEQVVANAAAASYRPTAADLAELDGIFPRNWQSLG